MEAADARANAAAGASAAGSLEVAAPCATPVAGIAPSSDEDESGGGAAVPCAIAAAMAACVTGSVPAAAGLLLEGESFSTLASADDGAELPDAFVSWFVVVSPDLADGTVAEGPGAASVRILAACGMVMPEPGAAGPAAEDGVVALRPAAEAAG
jgi:hypothetical protein